MSLHYYLSQVQTTQMTKIPFGNLSLTYQAKLVDPEMEVIQLALTQTSIQMKLPQLEQVCCLLTLGSYVTVSISSNEMLSNLPTDYRTCCYTLQLYFILF